MMVVGGIQQKDDKNTKRSLGLLIDCIRATVCMLMKRGKGLVSMSWAGLDIV